MLARLIAVMISLFSSIAAAHQAIDDQIVRINGLIKATPHNRELYIQRGELHRQHSDWQSALKDYRHAKRINGASGDTDFYIGRLWLDMGQASKALPLLQRFTRSNPGHTVALVNRGDAYFALNDFIRASASYQKAIDFDKKPNPDLFLKTFRAFEAAGPNYRKDAKAVIYEGIAQLGPLVTLIAAGIELEISQKNYNQALEFVDRLPKIVKNSPKWLARRGEILQSAGRYKEAVLAYSDVVSRIESLPPSRRNTRQMTRLIKRFEPYKNNDFIETRGVQ